MSVCVNCRSPLVVIDVQVSDAQLQMASCSTCESRTWRRADAVVDLAEVLAAAAADSRAGRPRRADPPAPA